MRKDKVLKEVVDTYGGGDASAAITVLEGKVKDLYATLETAVDWRMSRGKRTSKNSMPLATAPDKRFQDMSDMSDKVRKALDGTSEEE
jgi:hypothetical protein